MSCWPPVVPMAGAVVPVPQLHGVLSRLCDSWSCCPPASFWCMFTARREPSCPNSPCTPNFICPYISMQHLIQVLWAFPYVLQTQPLQRQVSPEKPQGSKALNRLSLGLRTRLSSLSCQSCRYQLCRGLGDGEGLPRFCPESCDMVPPSTLLLAGLCPVPCSWGLPSLVTLCSVPHAGVSVNSTWPCFGLLIPPSSHHADDAPRNFPLSISGPICRGNARSHSGLPLSDAMGTGPHCPTIPSMASAIHSISPHPFQRLLGAWGPSHSVFLSRSRKQEPFVASPAGASLLGLQRVLFSVLFTVLLWAVRFPHWGKACKWGGGVAGPHGGAMGGGGWRSTDMAFIAA